MTTTRVYSHPDIFLHDKWSNHQAMKRNRIETIHQALENLPFVECVSVNAASTSLLSLVHHNDYLMHLMNNAPSGSDTFLIDSGTEMNQHTMRAILLSVGAVVTAVDDVYQGKVNNAFCSVYAGHHATPGRGMGFCFLNNIAIGAQYAAKLGFKRIAVVDFDTHSGNGTIAALKGDDRFRFFETYQPGYPGPVFKEGESYHNIRRIPVNNRQSWLESWEYLLGDIEQIMPEIILISAGFDAHENDPLGITGIKDEDYAWLTNELVKIQPKIVSALEGGYSLEDTARCALLHVKSLNDYQENGF